MKSLFLIKAFSIATIFAYDPVFDGLYDTNLAKPLDESSIFSGFNLSELMDFNGSSDQKIDPAKYIRVNADSFYHTDDGFLYEFDAFIPFIALNKTLVFTNIRFVDFKAAPIECNFGIGLRHLTENQNILWGVYGFFDRKKSMHKNYFSQATFGVEIKAKKIWADLNIYIPVGTISKQRKAPILQVSNQQFFQNLFYNLEVEKALYGFDIEFGYPFPNNNHLRIFGGFYYFHAKHTPTLLGPFIRATYRIDNELKNQLRLFDYITIEIGARYDHKRHFDAYLGFRLTIPIGGGSVRHTKSLCKYFNDYIRRDINIVTQNIKSKL